MKKIVSLVFVLIFVFSLCSCGNSSTANTTTKDIAKSNSSADSTVSADTENAQLGCDLSQLSTTMAYSQTVNILNNVDDYLGKRIIIKGNFSPYPTEQRTYFNCLINDKSACCSAGFEFRLKDTSLVYPNDYPAENAEITVDGILSSYKEDNQTYYELIDAVIR